MDWVTLTLFFVASIVLGEIFRWMIRRAGARATDRMVTMMAAALRQDADAFERILPLYEDMISHDPSIAEALEVDRLDLIQYADDLRHTATGIELMASTRSNRERLAYMRERRRRRMG